MYSVLRVIVKVEKGISKKKILSYAGLLSDLTEEEQRRFDESIEKRRPLLRSLRLEWAKRMGGEKKTETYKLMNVRKRYNSGSIAIKNKPSRKSC